ncbi:MAG: TFIIB-type zinc ribbon-containing protein [Lachnospiraceae bacterium]|nr:TFIIB-type zinc ribbon-containing protein [Lachnospiraceae bacterium]
MAVITYKCPNCGGDLRFHPESQKYRCEYCLSEFTQEQLEEMTRQEETGPKGETPGVAQAKDLGANDGNPAGVTADMAKGTDGNPVLYNCPNCGAEIVTDESTTATFCYYCHNPVVLEGKMEGGYLPKYAIPFAIDRDKALKIFEQWIGKKRYIPKAFYSKDQIDKMTGVYFPYWLYSCQVDGRMDAEGVKHKDWVTGNTRYTQTDKYDVSREGTMKVDHVTRNALSKANRKLVEGVLPFEMEKLQPFHMGYLSGFVAEKRDLEEAKFQDEVQQEVRGFAEEALKSEVAGYDAVTVREQTMDLKDEKWDYALMPVWTLTYKDPKQDKIYYFACNGQTGKICGELPVDQTRLLLLFASIFAPLFVILMIVGYFL